MKFSGRTQMVSRFSVDIILPMFKKLGFEGLEFGLLDQHFNVRPDLLEDYIIEHNVGLANELELPITAVSNHLGFTMDDYVFGVHKQTIPKIRKFGTNVYIISAGFVSAQDKLYNPEWYMKLVERVKMLCEIAEESGVVLAIEPEPGQMIATVADFHDLKAEVESDVLKMNFDIGHGYLMEADLLEAIKENCGDIAHCHIENMRRGEHIHLPPDEGEIDMEVVLSTLADCGFDGGLALDMYLRPYEETAEAALEYLKGLRTRSA